MLLSIKTVVMALSASRAHQGLWLWCEKEWRRALLKNIHVEPYAHISVVNKD